MKSFPFHLACLLLFCCAHIVSAQQPAPSQSAVAQFAKTLKKGQQHLKGQSFMNTPISKEQVQEVAKLAWDAQLKSIKKRLESSWKNNLFTYKEHKMPIFHTTFGEKPKDGYSLYISMHGGGGTAPEVNDEQWENQKHLYTLEEGVYVAPRASTNDWNLWHQEQIDVLFADIIQAAVVMKDINLNKVYIIGYSAGGDGVYQLAPRMADYWAGAGMFAGHPNETSPLGLRNVPFALWVGAQDGAYNRNGVALEWKTKLDELQQKDPQGYEHQVATPDYGHWMMSEEKVALPWLAKYTRNPIPNKVVWKQDDVLHTNFYWLAVPQNLAKQGDEIVLSYKEQSVYIEQLPEHEEVIIYLNDAMMDLDKPVKVYYKNNLVQELTLKRKIETIWETCQTRCDKHLIFSAKIHFQKGKILNRNSASVT